MAEGNFGRCGRAESTSWTSRLQPNLRASKRFARRGFRFGGAVSWPAGGCDGIPTGCRVANEPGAGAAGGLGFGLCSFLGARLVPGFGLFAEHTGLKARLAEADLVLTGEGSIDKSTLMGKGVGELAALCRGAKIPCLGLAGAVNDRAAVAQLFTRTYAMSPDLTDRATAMANNAAWLARLATHAADRLGRSKFVAFRSTSSLKTHLGVNQTRAREQTNLRRTLSTQ